MGIMSRMRSKDGFILASAIDCTDIVETARSIHNTSPTATAALGRALSIASLIGKTLKAERGSVTLQFKGGGPGGTLIAVSDSDGNVRGYIQNPPVDPERKTDGKLDVGALIGSDGYLNVIKDLGLERPYIGTVGLLSGEIAEDVALYFIESEQIPTACAAGVLLDPDGSVLCAGAYLLQLMPGFDKDYPEKLESFVLKAGTVTDMLREGLSPVKMIERAVGKRKWYCWKKPVLNTAATAAGTGYKAHLSARARKNFTRWLKNRAGQKSPVNSVTRCITLQKTRYWNSSSGYRDMRV